ncbi:hypothetical protein K1719_004707 [Acacia pycnantha]|nr:hypothetical protein K1719_004707 [Acacia pycnantha]
MEPGNLYLGFSFTRKSQFSSTMVNPSANPPLLCSTSTSSAFAFRSIRASSSLARFWVDFIDKKEGHEPYERAPNQVRRHGVGGETEGEAHNGGEFPKINPRGKEAANRIRAGRILWCYRERDSKLVCGEVS